MAKKEQKFVWIVFRDWKGDFKPKKVLKLDADKTSLVQHKTEEDCLKAIGNIHIEPDH